MATCIVRILLDIQVFLVFYFYLTHRSQGIGGWGGGLSEYVALDTRYVHILPEGIPCTFIIVDSVHHELEIKVDGKFIELVDVGAVLEPLAVAWYGVKKSNFKKGQTAFIIGAGPVCLPQLLTQVRQVLNHCFLPRSDCVSSKFYGMFYAFLG